jgi:ankyrin repeat protein
MQERPEVSTPGTGGNALLVAATKGRLEVVQFFLDSGADPNKKAGPPWSGYHHHRSGLAAAAEGGSLDVVQLMLSHNEASGLSSHNTRDLPTALVAAVRSRRSAVVQLLLEMDVPMGAHWHHAYLTAVQHRDLDVVRLLLSKPPAEQPVMFLLPGIRAPTTTEHHPLVVGVARGAGIVRLVLNSPASSDIGSDIGSDILTSALLRAAQLGQVDTLQLLIDRGADVNGGLGTLSSGSPLGVAIHASKPAAVQFLLQKGAHVDSGALMLAVKRGVAPLLNTTEVGPVMEALLAHGVRDVPENSALLLSQANMTSCSCS